MILRGGTVLECTVTVDALIDDDGDAIAVIAALGCGSGVRCRPHRPLAPQLTDHGAALQTTFSLRMSCGRGPL